MSDTMQYLDENKKLILAILDNQNLGKLSECAQYQAQLQKNLMYLAAIADAQPQAPAVPAQMTPHPAMPQGGYYLQHPQAAPMTQQPGIFPPRAPFSNMHPLQDPQVQQYQTQGQIAMRPVAPNSGINPSHNETNLGGGNNSIPASNAELNATHGGTKQDKPDASSDGQGNSTVAHGS